VFAAVSAILGNAPDRNEADDTIQAGRDTRLDQLWKTIEPVLQGMMAVRAVDWIKIEALKIFSALTSPVAQQEPPINTLDSLLHHGFLEGEIANVEIAPKGREQAILELAQMLAEKRIQPEQLPRLPAGWIASKFPSRLGPMFRHALKGLYGLHDISVVSELLDPAPELPVSRFGRGSTDRSVAEESCMSSASRLTWERSGPACYTPSRKARLVSTVGRS
jgi:hypothetical protein